MDTEDLKIALLIDSDNISPKYMDTLFDELKSVGVVTFTATGRATTLSAGNRFCRITP